MSTVSPKLLYSDATHRQIPVWEIICESGKRIYYERVHREGYRPIAILNSLQLAGSTVSVCDIVRRQGNKPIHVLKEKDGYVAPMSWYERHPAANGRSSSPQACGNDITVNHYGSNDAFEDYEDYEEYDYLSDGSQ